MNGFGWPVEVNVHRAEGPLRAVVTGVGGVREHLAGELADQGVQRPLVVCGEHVGASAAAEIVRDVLAGRWEPAVFTGVRPHTPFTAVTEGADAARRVRADALVAVGGGSTTDCARGIALMLAEGHTDMRDLPPARFGSLATAPTAPAAGGPPPMPIACVPTTLSFAEFLPFFGARDPATARKLPYLERGLVVRTVFLDGEIAASTPATVWNETGVKAVDDALFTYCSSAGPEPFLDPVLESALRAVVAELDAPAGPAVARARQQVFVAVWMTKHALPRVGPRALTAWFSTAARHALGGVCEVPHGVASCVALPTGLGFHAAATAPRQAALAPVFTGRPDAAVEQPLDAAVAAWLERLGVPTHLRDVDRADALGEDDLDTVARAMCDEAPALGGYEVVRTALAGIR